MSTDRDVVFLSWGGEASADIAAVLQPILQSHLPDAVVFFSETSIEIGDDPMRTMFEDSLERAKALVAVLTTESAGRPWVVWETATVWAKGRLVVPLFVDVDPGSVPGPLSIKIQGARISDRTKVDQALNKIANAVGKVGKQSLSDEEWEKLKESASAAAARATLAPALLPIAAEFTERTLPLHDGLRAGTLLAVEVRAHNEIDQASVVMTALTGPSGAITMPSPARLFWHPGRQIVTTIAQGATGLINIVREGPDVPGALMDSPDHDLPWSLPNGAYGVEIQLIARGFPVQLIVAEFVVRPADGLGQSIEWSGLTAS